MALAVICTLALLFAHQSQCHALWEKQIVPFLVDSRVASLALAVVGISAVFFVIYRLNRCASLTREEAGKLTTLAIHYKWSERGDKSVLQRLKVHAEAGDVAAQTALGDYYIRVKFARVPKLNRQGVVWYRKAAGKGDPVAQYRLACMLKNESTEAALWCRKAADQGYMPAVCMLGELYEEGNGVPQDLAEADRWYRKHFYSRSCFHIGRTTHYKLLQWGSRIAIALVTITTLALLFTHQPDCHALWEKQIVPFLADSRVVSLAQALVGIGVVLSISHLLKRHRLKPTEKRVDYAKAVAQGDSAAQYKLGMAYESGDHDSEEMSRPRSRTQAVAWYRKAAEQGHREAQYRLGIVLSSAVFKDYAGAASSFEQATTQGDCSAPYFLAELYASGKGVALDTTKAAEYYGLSALRGGYLALEPIEKLAESGNATAQYYLGEVYTRGRLIGLQGGAEAATDWYRKAAAQGESRAQAKLSAMAAPV